MTQTIDQVIVDFLAYGLEKGYIHPLDHILKQNQLLAFLEKDALEEGLSPSQPLPEARNCLSAFISYAVQEQLIENSLTDSDIFKAQIMSFVTPDTSVMNDRFWQKYAVGPELATDYYYTLSIDNDYIQTEAIAKNVEFSYDSPYGALELTINLSKPEKDPKAIAAAKNAVTVAYPKCQLCLENEGYLGHLTHPARANHRIVRFPLNGETWGLQYSPYAYYDEHCIFLASQHRPMRITERTFENLFAITEQFPHYFVGSNADLPIVGGSILSHDHYQGGRHTFAMDLAPLLADVNLPSFPEVSAGLVKWPLSVIRLESKDKMALQKASVHILEKWRAYSDPSVDILAYTDGTPHNTITPIARRNGERFVCDLVLRNNRTTAAFPDGIFHPHPDVQHIKKENIGLIEVMGLAILPPRLKTELADVERYLLGETNMINPIHADWAETISLPFEMTAESVHATIQDAVGSVFQRVLEDAGVFKLTDQGLAAFKRFANRL